MPIDVLIIGQGLAGSLLAWQLLREGLSILVIDDGAQNASQVAAGLINPITGQRLVKSAHVDELLPLAMACYRELAEVFKQTFFVSLPMWRSLSDANLRRVAERRLVDANYESYLEGITETVKGLSSTHGVLRQRHTGFLRTEALLACLRHHLMSLQRYRCVMLDYADIRLNPVLCWQDIQPRHLVFCEGHRARVNPWFGTLPFQVAKGEILECRTSANCPETIMNYGDWWLPQGEHRFKLGATFDVNDAYPHPTLEAQKRLLMGLARAMPGLSPIDVVEQRAGIRPATLDKQPFIGTHPRYANLHVFNGFGAKGSLAIPGYARYFAAWLKQQIPLPAHCDVRRYYETSFPA